MKNKNFYGENGTDKIIRNDFYPDYDYKGIMIEIGAGFPEELSLSKHFRDSGWRCICIEANPELCAEHRNLGNEIYNYACSNDFHIKEHSNEKRKTKFYVNKDAPLSHSALGMRYDQDPKYLKEIEIDVITLNELMEKLNIENVDFICVDVEGWELEVMDGFNLQKYKPKVVVLENYSKNPSYNDYMESKGYKLKTKISHNEIYERNS